MKGINNYDSTFEELYYQFNRKVDFTSIRQEIDDLRAELRETLSSDDRKKVLKIVDLKNDMILEQAISSFASGYILAHNLAFEINNRKSNFCPT